MPSNCHTVFRYLLAVNITVGKPYLIQGRGLGVVKGILTRSDTYLTQEGARTRIEDIFRLCLRFDDDQQGECLDPSDPGEFLMVPGWGTYTPNGRG